MSRATITPAARNEATVTAPVVLHAEGRRIEAMLDWSFPSIEAACAFCVLCEFNWTLVVPPPARAA